MREKLLRNIYTNKQKQNSISYVLEIRNLYLDKLYIQIQFLSIFITYE